MEFVDIFPTLLDLCRVKIPENVQGRSLAPLLEGKTKTHRNEVFIEYAPNEEAAVRDEHWKLIFERGKRRRADGYDTGLPLPGRTIRLYDLEKDAAEMHNVAARPENAERVRQMLQDLADHMRSTAREPALVPQSDDSLEVLDYCVQSHDVGVPATSERPAGCLPPAPPAVLCWPAAIRWRSCSRRWSAGWLPVVFRLTHTRLQIAMSLCGGLMLGVSLFHLLPQSVGIYGSARSQSCSG